MKADDWSGRDDDVVTTYTANSRRRRENVIQTRLDMAASRGPSALADTCFAAGAPMPSL